MGHVEKPDQFLAQLEAPKTWGRRRVEATREELEQETGSLRQMAAWASAVQAGG